MIRALKSYIYRTWFWHSLFKKRRELEHWEDRKKAILKWFRGEEPYLFPFPNASTRVSGFDEVTNALLTFIKVENQHASYLSDLRLRGDSFRGLKLGDIGSGPFPTLLVFEDCERYCIDHLIHDYESMGFPLSAFKPEVHFVHARSEKMPLSEGFFDALISRNALDHVDDFEATAREIKRVLKPDGYLHILVNYHTPTPTEPTALNDSIIAQNFEQLKLRKLSETPGAWGFSGGTTVLWSNVPETLLG